MSNNIIEDIGLHDTGLEWKDYELAQCSDMDSDLFFPENERVVPKEVAIACGSCVLREECLNYALTSGQIGIWGGTSEIQRRRIRRRNIYHASRNPDYEWRAF